MRKTERNCDRYTRAVDEFCSLSRRRARAKQGGLLLAQFVLSDFTAETCVLALAWEGWKRKDDAAGIRPRAQDDIESGVHA